MPILRRTLIASVITTALVAAGCSAAPRPTPTAGQLHFYADDHATATPDLSVAGIVDGEIRHNEDDGIEMSLTLTERDAVGLRRIMERRRGERIFVTFGQTEVWRPRVKNPLAGRKIGILMPDATDPTALATQIIEELTRS